jgi:hypothetical protein
MRTALVRPLPLFALAAASVMLAACSKDESAKGSPPPPPPAASAKADVCAKGGGTLADADAARFFPRTTNGFCLDPNGKGESFGEGASQPIDKICDLFDGECEIYRGFNVRRVTEIRYVDGKGTPATIDVHLSKFGTSEAAYAMFTKRVVGDGDPADDATPQAIEGGGAAALGLGNAYVWRGAYLAEITYNDETVKEEAALKAASTKLLPPLVKEVGDKLPGEPTLPAAAAALPKDEQLPLGVRYETKDALGIDGLGAGAFGYYRAADKRWRVLSLVRGDVDQAKDVITTLMKRPGATKEKGVAEQAVRFMHEDEDKVPVEWIVARRGKTLVGIGDEVRVLRTGMTADDHAKVTLTKDDKIAHLKKALGL